MLSTSQFGHQLFILSISAPMLLTCKMNRECQSSETALLPRLSAAPYREDPGTKGWWQWGTDKVKGSCCCPGSCKQQGALAAQDTTGAQSGPWGLPELWSPIKPEWKHNTSSHTPAGANPSMAWPMGNMVTRTQPPCETYIPGNIVSFCFLQVQRKQICEIRGKRQICPWHVE